MTLYGSLIVCSQNLSFFIITQFAKLYVRVGILLTCGKQLHDGIISLRREVWANKTRLISPTFYWRHDLSISARISSRGLHISPRRTILHILPTNCFMGNKNEIIQWLYMEIKLCVLEIYLFNIQINFHIKSLISVFVNVNVHRHIERD
jgi:hypothetical protein